MSATLKPCPSMPDRIWADRDEETGEKRWFSVRGMGREYVRADGWQPIESAPKGEEDMILMFEPHEMGGFMFAGCWDQRGEWRNNLDSEVQKPTHWMPLPPAPEAS